jgi:hypothetical protein
MLGAAAEREARTMARASVKNFRLALGTAAIVAALVALRALLFELGVEGMEPTALVSSIIGGGVFVLGLVIAGTLSDYKDAERAPTDLAAGLYAILREAEAMHEVWRLPDLPRLRERLLEVVSALRRDIDAGNTRECQSAIEGLSRSFRELEKSDVPANYVVRLRQEQAGLRKAVLRIYHIQREEFLPSAYAMIVSFVVMILGLLMFTMIQGRIETLVTIGFLAFFFVYLLRLLNVINKPFKVGEQRSDDDVSLFLLYEFAVHARHADADLDGGQVAEIVERLEDQEAAGGEAAAAGSDGSGVADIDQAVDAAVASVQEDPQAPPERA